MLKKINYTDTLPDLRRNNLSNMLSKSLGTTQEERLRPKSQYTPQHAINEEQEEEDNYSTIGDDFYHGMNQKNREYTSLEYYLDKIEEQPNGIESINSTKFMELFPEFKSSSIIRRLYGSPFKNIGCFSRENTNQLLKDINDTLKTTREKMNQKNITEEEIKEMEIMIELKNKLKSWNRGCTGYIGLEGGTRKRRSNKRKTKKHHSNKRKSKKHRSNKRKTRK